MARYDIEGSIVDTSKASRCWSEDTYFDGRDQISVNTGSEWEHQTLYRSRKGRYYIVSSSAWQGTARTAEWVSPQEATRWLLLNKEELPADLKEYEEAIVE